MPNIPAIENNVTLTRPETFLHIGPSLENVQTVTTNDEENPEYNISGEADWVTITKSLDGISTAQIEINAADLDDDGLYWPETDPLSRFGLSIGDPGTERWFVAITTNEESSRPLFLGYFNGVDVQADNNLINISCYGIEGLLREIKIDGAYVNYDLGENKYIWRPGECVFNKPYDNRIFIDGDFWMSHHASNPWSATDILRYFEGIYSQRQTYDNGNVTDHPAQMGPIRDRAPKRIGVSIRGDSEDSDILDSDAFVFGIYYTLPDDLLADGVSQYPHPFDTTGMTLWRVLTETVRMMGPVAITADYVMINNSIRCHLIASDLRPDETNNKISLDWGTRGDEASVQHDVENLTVNANRDQKIRKVVTIGQPTIIQTNLIICDNASKWDDDYVLADELPIDDIENTISGGEINDRYLRMTKVSGTDETLWEVRPKVTMPWIYDGDIDIWGTQVPFYSDAPARIASKLVENDTDDRMVIEAWVWDTDQWKTLSEYNITSQLARDGYGIQFMGDDRVLDAWRDLLDRTTDPTDSSDITAYIIIRAALISDHHVRGVYGLDVNDSETDVESDITYERDDQVLIVNNIDAREEIVLNSFGVGGGSLSVQEADASLSYKKYTDAQDTADNRAKELFEKTKLNAISGSIKLHGWRQIAPGYTIGRLTGAGRTVKLGTTIDSVTYSRNYATTISMSRGQK